MKHNKVKLSKIPKDWEINREKESKSKNFEFSRYLEELNQATDSHKKVTPEELEISL